MFSRFTDPSAFLENTVAPTQSSPSVGSNADSSSNGVNSTNNTPTPNTSTPNTGNNATTNSAPTPPRGRVNVGEGKLNETSSNSVKNLPKSMKEEFNYDRLPLRIKDMREKIIYENMDFTDMDTLEGMRNLDEAEENSVLLSLTNKLYEMVVGKVDDIDFGDIPQSRGNIYKFSKYKQVRDCIECMHDIFVQYKEDTAPIDEIEHALSNLENNRDLFIACYAGNIEVGKMIYETIALAIVQSISYMIAVTIEFIKTPRRDTLQIVVDKTGVSKAKDHILYQSLFKFNESCASGDIDKVLRPLIKNRSKNLIETIAIGVTGAIVIAIFASSIIGFLRDLVYFFYASRERMSTYLDIQSNLLEMNAQELKDNDYIATVGNKDKVIKRQLAIASMFHKVADKIAIDAKSSDTKASREIKADTKKYRLDSVNTNPTDAEGPLF